MLEKVIRWPESLGAINENTFPLVCLNMPNIKSLENEALDYFKNSPSKVSIAIMQMTSIESPSERYPDVVDQINWNESYRRLARVNGVNIFYLPQFKKGDVMAMHGRLTALHIPEYVLQHTSNGVQVAIGISIMAPQYDYLKNYLSKVNKDIPVFNTLLQTCEHADFLCRK